MLTTPTKIKMNFSFFYCPKEEKSLCNNKGMINEIKKAAKRKN